MFFPIMLADRKGAAVERKFPLYLGTQFLTNVFMIPYMALRQFDNGRPNAAEPGVEPSRLPSYAGVLGCVAAVVGLVTIGWIPLARPEFGNLADRCGRSPSCWLLSPCKHTFARVQECIGP